MIKSIFTFNERTWPYGKSKRKENREAKNCLLTPTVNTYEAKTPLNNWHSL